jgi:hypothetical protein
VLPGRNPCAGEALTTVKGVKHLTTVTLPNHSCVLRAASACAEVRRVKILPIASTLALFLGCAKTPPDPPAGAVPSNASTGASQSVDAKTQQTVEISVLGLKGKVPAGAPVPKVGGDDMVLVEGGKFTVRLWAAKPADPKTLADGQAFANNFKPKNVQSETLGDGWSITFETVGPSFIVIASRDLAGKAVHCEATEDSVEEQRAALAFCKSLAR